MITEYINTDGKTIVIAEMTDPHLVNAYVKYKKQVTLLEEKLINNPALSGAVQLRLRELKDIKTALKEEVNKRNLID